jgi:hypothetical protein
MLSNMPNRLWSANCDVRYRSTNAFLENQAIIFLVMVTRLCPKQGLLARRTAGSCDLAESPGFQGFLPIDRGIEHEQNLKKHTIASILVYARSSRLADFIASRAQDS